MIYTFNETSTPVWEIVDKNDTFFRINVKGDGRYHFGIDMVKKNYTLDDFFLDILEPDVIAQNKKAIWALADISFSLCYNIKNGIPFIKPVKRQTPNSYDLYCLTYEKPNNSVLIHERGNRFTVVNVCEPEGTNLVHIIGLAKPSAKPYYYLTYRETVTNTVDENGIEHPSYLYHTKHIVTVKSGEIGIFRHTYYESEVHANPYKSNIIGKNEPTSIKITKVMRPYALIVYPFDNTEILTDICEKRYGCNERYNKYVDSNIKNLPTILYNMRKTEYYSAATFYVNHTFAELTKEMAEAECELSTRFKRVNYLCSDGKVKSFD